MHGRLPRRRLRPFYDALTGRSKPLSGQQIIQHYATLGRFYAWMTPEKLQEMTEPQLYLYETGLRGTLEMEAKLVAHELIKVLAPALGIKLKR